MNRNNYYYRKLAQAFIFAEDSWKDIVDFGDPHDNIFTKEFILQLEDLLVEYYQQSCLEESEKENVISLLNDIRFCYPYQNQAEKSFVYGKVNNMLDLTNETSNQYVIEFCKREYEKRYGRYLNFGCLKKFSYLLFSEFLKEGVCGVKNDISQDIYPLTLLFHSLDELSIEHKNVFLASQWFLSTLSAKEVECPKILNDSEIRNRFLSILKESQYYFKNPQSLDRDGDFDFRTCIQNKILLRRLEKIK